jgi:hypothetical protein
VTPVDEVSRDPYLELECSAQNDLVPIIPANLSSQCRHLADPRRSSPEFILFRAMLLKQKESTVDRRTAHFDQNEGCRWR